MAITITRYTHGVLVRIEGQLDSATSTAVQEEIVAGLPGNLGARVILDCSGLEYISSAGLRAVLAVARHIEGRSKAKLTLAAVQPLVREVFEISGMDSAFKFKDAVEAELLGDLAG